MQFVDFSMEQEPLLVMEYLPLGSLASQRGITEEESLGILCQGLQALVEVGIKKREKKNGWRSKKIFGDIYGTIAGQQ